MKRIILFVILTAILLLCGCSDNASVSDNLQYHDDTDAAESNNPDIETTSSSASVPENSAPEIPDEYRTVINDLKTIVEFRISKTFEAEYNDGYFPETGEWFDFNSLSEQLQYAWSCMIAEMPGYPDGYSLDRYGYVLKDVNGDGIDELFFVRKDHSIIAIFTLVDGNPQLCDAFWSRYKCVITDKNEIYTLGSSGADHFDYIVKKLNFKNRFTVIKEFGADGEYYETVDNERVIVDKSRFDELCNEYPLVNGESWTESFIFDFE